MKKVLFTLLLCGISFIQVNAQIVKSYMFLEAVGSSPQGPIYGSGQGRMATWVEWNDEMTFCKMFDGTKWRYSREDRYGYRYYSYAGTSGVAMPMTQYVEAIFSSDWSRLQINYTFGMMGMVSPQASKYSYIGEGTQPAYDYINGNY